MANALQNEPDFIFDIEAKAPSTGWLAIAGARIPRIGQPPKPWHPADVSQINHYLNPFASILQKIGQASALEPNRQSIFGQNNYVRIRLDIIAAPEVLKKWIGYGEDEWDIASGLGIGQKYKGPRYDDDVDDDDEEEDDCGIRTMFVTQPGPCEKCLVAWRTDMIKVLGVNFPDVFISRMSPVPENPQPGDFVNWVRLAQTTDTDFEYFGEPSRSVRG